MKDSREFRELIRIMERRLGLLNKESNGCCCSITLAQCHALVEIGRHSSISINELAGILNLDKSTMSRTVDNLVKKKYAYKVQSDKDKRGIEIKLTDEGNKIFNDIEYKMNNKFNRIFEIIPTDQRENVLKSMEVLVKALDVENFNTDK